MASLFSDRKELTKYGFISHMEAYMGRLLHDYKAQPDEYLKSHGIDGKKALELLLKRTDPSDENSAVLKRKERISPEKLEPGDTRVPKDRFHIKYSIVKKDYWPKMEKIYDEFVGKEKLNEEDGGGATSCAGVMGDGGSNTDNDGSYVTNVFPVYRRKTIYVTEEQMKYIREEAELDTAFGDFGYDAPASISSSDDPTLDHQNIMRDSFNGYKKEKVNYTRK